MKNREIRIDHPSQLNSLSTLPFIRNTPRGTLRLAGYMEKHFQKERWERELNANYQACGCASSAKFLILGTVLSTTYVLAIELGKADGASWGWAALIVLATSLAGAVLGKIVGLVAANQKLKHTIAEIKGGWKTEDKPQANPIYCG